MRTAAILPVKRFSHAKQRLNESVADSLRLDLARAMVGDVLSALRDCAAIERTVVVTCEESVAAAARYLEAIVIPDAAEAGQSAAVAQGIERAAAEGFERVLCIPGDCPALDPSELEALLAETGIRATGECLPASVRGECLPASATEPGAARGGREVVIVPDRHGTGTNALALAPPAAIPPGFGEGSCARHVAAARHAGIPFGVEELPSLALDLDTPADVVALTRELEARRGRARRTAKALGL
jgi:2-phospho-L-lactate/phosphoenolpyruvate guanylyltransferase